MSMAHFTPALFRFLKDLAKNNDRTWFKKNQERFESDVREPLLRFITDLGPRMAKISEQIVVDARRSGGSMFRIHRDTRFSKDKSPYKTHAAAQFRHAWGKDVHAPGYYLHLEPGSVFMAGGIWRPDSKAVTRIRAGIVHDPDGWKKVVRAPAFRKRYALEGESLKRPPRTVPKDHPLMEDLKRKDFMAVARYDEKVACDAGFLTTFVKDCRGSSKLLAYLAGCLDIPW
jgi:uncharacterized protein (TIGR02453 family)